MWYDETIKNMAFQRDKVLGSCMTEDEEEAKMLNAILDELKLNALVITDPYNMRHVSGFRGGEGALYISAAQKVLITDSRAKAELPLCCGNLVQDYKNKK